jgi:hypothetical protein
MSVFDYIIVGGGMAGLHISKLLAKKFPDASICIVEKYGNWGGRVSTVRIRDDPKIHFEAGAGRIARWHKHVAAYIKEFGLTTTPLHPNNVHRHVEDDGSITIGKNDFGEIAAAMIKGLPEGGLKETTIKEECEKVYGSKVVERVFSEFGYRAEVEVLRGDLAKDILSSGGFQGEHSDYYIVNEGLSEIPSRLATKVLEMGVRLITDVTVTGAERDGVWTVKGVCKERPWSLQGKNIIWALHRNALAEIPLFKDAWFIKGVRMEPLLRIYARFPLVGGKPWFHDIGNVTTNDPLRYIIPYNSAAGLIMISYTDAQDTEFWHSIKDKEERQKEVMKHVRRLFPEKDIPEPDYWSHQHWADGCSYWLPSPEGRASPDPRKQGPKDAHLAQHAVHYPFPSEMPHMYVCGESWSCCQAWIEGAIRSAEGIFEEQFNKK